jgi:hypothetical protein
MHMQQQTSNFTLMSNKNHNAVQSNMPDMEFSIGDPASGWNNQHDSRHHQVAKSAYSAPTMHQVSSIEQSAEQTALKNQIISLE